MAKKKKRAARPTARPRRPIAARGRSARLSAFQTLDVYTCERFLQHEAQLLDDGQFNDWLALFMPEAWYWVPSEPGQADPFETVSLIYDDRRLLETRVRRLSSPRMYSQEPRSRTSRMIGNVTIEETGPFPAVDRSRERMELWYLVRSKFMMIEYRREQQRLFGGTALHRLVQTDGGVMIAWKRVDLVNCDAPLDGITIPF
jgi:3-phenylpropionate/cinnamic acid dioxygenase small subunit